MVKRKNARLLFPALSSLLTAIILLVAFTLTRGPVQYVILLFAGFTAVMFVPAAVAVTQDVVHPGLRAVSLSLCVIIQHILGSALGPPFIGMLSDRYGLETSLMFLPLFTSLAGVLFLVAADLVTPMTCGELNPCRVNLMVYKCSGAEQNFRPTLTGTNRQGGGWMDLKKSESLYRQSNRVYL